MDVKVEGGDEFANASYEKICDDIFRDIGLRSNIDRAYMYCNAAEHVFIISVKIGRVPSPVKVWDVTQREGDKLRITDEKYAPKLLALMWDKYGDRVQQISRLVIGFELKEEEIPDFNDLIVYDPREDLNTRVLDGIDRILPEGARVRYPMPSTEGITIIASENQIAEEWKEKAKEVMSKMEMTSGEGGT
ncbi:MAG: methanogenesis marker 17 protein [Methanophagales archaeon]|nr:methanogenesis marker 17 protein [Methanophagales archaeon]MCW3141310.1 methanogenesis marker 17 protein [Methanophagales archaeon]